jgi:hypothetical protein
VAREMAKLLAACLALAALSLLLVAAELRPVRTAWVFRSWRILSAGRVYTSGRAGTASDCPPGG